MKELIDWESIKEEGANYLQRLIQINTSNPPGNEMSAAQYIKTIAKENGLYPQIIETGPHRGNIIISYNKTYHNPIILLSHLDVVPADSKDWTFDPFEGQIVNDVLWGRGAIDAKVVTIMHLMTLILMKRNEIDLPFDLVLVSTADEENGGTNGLNAILPEYQSLFTNALVLNEGGGFPLTIKNHHYYLCETGQKGVCRITFTCNQERNHNPYFPRNTELVNTSQLIQRIYSLHFPGKTPQTTQILLSELLKSTSYNPEELRTTKEKLQAIKNEVSPFMYRLLSAMTETTFTVTKWNGGRKNSNYCGNSEIQVDCRVLPGVTKEEIEHQLDALIVNSNVSYKIDIFEEGYESPSSSRLFNEMEAVVHELVPNATVVPFITVGSNDGRHLKPYKSIVYGFSPMLPDMSFEKILPMIHGVDEKVPLNSLRFGIQVLFETLKRVGGS